MFKLLRKARYISKWPENIRWPPLEERKRKSEFYLGLARGYPPLSGPLNLGKQPKEIRVSLYVLVRDYLHARRFHVLRLSAEKQDINVGTSKYVEACGDEKSKFRYFEIRGRPKTAEGNW